MNEKNLVSVVLTCYNYGNYVKDAIDSVLKQTYQNYELIIINDGSEDDSDERIKDFLPNGRIIYLRQENRGQAYAKNRGITHSRGRYIAFIDADDIWLETKLEKQMPLFNNSDIGVVYSRLTYIDSKGNSHRKKREGFFLGPYRGKITKMMFLRNFVPFSSAVVRRECVEKVGAFDESLSMGIDWDLWLRMSLDYKFEFCDEPLLMYRIGHKNQMSGNIPIRHQCSDRIMEKFLQEHQGDISSAVVRKARGFTYYNRARQLYEQNRMMSTEYYMKAIRYPQFTLNSIKGLLKIGISSLEKNKMINNNRGSIFVPHNNKNKTYEIKGVGYLIDTISCDTEGTQRQLLETIKRLDREKYRPVLFCLRNSSWMNENELPCETIILGFKGFIKPNIISVTAIFRKNIKDYGIHIIQAFFEDSRIFAFFSTRLMVNPPLLIASKRDIGLDKKRPWYHHLYKKLYPVINRWYTGILTNSQQVSDFVRSAEKVPESKIKVIYNGVNLEHEQYDTPSIIQNHKDSEGCMRVGIVASLTPVKRIDTYIKAVAKVRNDYGSVKIKGYIIGEGRERKALENLSQELGIQDAIDFTGAVKNVPAYLQNIHVGVNCSEREGLSNAVIEYMSFGLPVIATAVGGNVELVNHERGFLVETGNVHQLSEALVRMAQNSELRKKLGMNAREFIVENFSWKRSIQELQMYYDKLNDYGKRENKSNGTIHCGNAKKSFG